MVDGSKGQDASAANGAAKAAEAQTIDQVRELLFGSEQRSLEQQIVELRAELAQERERFTKELEAMRTATANDAENDRQRTDAHIRKIGEALQGIGESIVKLPR